MRSLCAPPLHSPRARERGRHDKRRGRQGYAGRAAAFCAAVLGALAALAMVAATGTKPAEAAFPGKNGKIAFASDRDGNHDIYAMNADGTGEKRLTTDAAYDLSPAWSPDGKRIAFESYREGAHEIYVMGADGTSQTRLTFNATSESEPSWQPLAR